MAAAKKKTTAKTPKKKPAAPAMAPSKAVVKEYMERTGISGRALAAAAGLSKNAINMGFDRKRLHQEFDETTQLALAKAGISGLLAPTQAAAPAAATPAAGLSSPAAGGSDANPNRPQARAAESPNRPLVSFDQLLLSGLNYRKTIDDEGLAELADNIAQHGFLQNLVVRPKAGSPGRFEILAGERRFRAVQKLVKEKRWMPGARAIPVAIKELDDADALALALIENLQREEVNPMEEAEAFARLQQIDPEKWNTQAIADAVRKSLRYVQQRIQMVNKLAPEVKDKVRAGEMSVAYARELVIATPGQQKNLLREIEYKENGADHLRARLTRNLPKVSDAIFDLSLYTGEYVENVPVWGGKPSRRFADKAQFDRLQKAALTVRKQKLLAQGWAFVDIKRCPSYNNVDDYYVSSKDEKKAGAVILIRDGKVTMKTNVVPKPQRGTNANAASAPKESKAERDAREKAQREAEKRWKEQVPPFLLALQERIAGDITLALRIMIMREMHPTYCALLGQVPNSADFPKRHREDFKGIKVSPHGLQSAYNSDPIKLWGVIAGLDETKVIAISASYIAGIIDPDDMDAEDRDGALLAAIAAAAGVPLPPCLGGPEPKAEQKEAA